jgi:hypothetical protein
VAPVRDSQVHKTNSSLSTARRRAPHCTSAHRPQWSVLIIYCIALGSSTHIDSSTAELGQLGKVVRGRKSDWLLEHVFFSVNGLCFHALCSSMKRNGSQNNTSALFMNQCNAH